MSCIYKTRDDDSCIGLNNQICESRDYYCRSHRIYLSLADVERRRCLHKPTFDMISTNSCNWLEKVTKE